VGAIFQGRIIDLSRAATVALGPGALSESGPVLICCVAFLNQSKVGRLIRHHRPVSWQSSVMRTSVALPPILKWMEQRMPERRRFTQTTSLEGLVKEATQLRKQAQGTPPSDVRDLLVRKARRAETASHMTKWPAGYRHQDKFN
jgi:hypothetical protein